ncbi:MAG: hypothetical protein R3B13_00390 [Polyangiaceae bacterium]
MSAQAHAQTPSAGDESVATWQPGASGVSPAPENAPAPDERDELEPSKRLSNTLIALGPGLVVRGSGQRAAGHGAAADALLATELAGLGLVVVGLGGLVLTGASRYTAGPFAATMVVGGGLFATSYAADVYTTFRPDGTLRDPPTHAPVTVSEVGHRYVYDPQFRYRHFLYEALEARVGRLALAPSAQFSLDDDNARLSGELRVRLQGPLPDGPPATDGSYWDVGIGASHHRYASDGFRMDGGELFMRLRRDLDRYAPSLRGGFAEGALGIGLLRTSYDIPGTEVPADGSTLLLAEFAFGAYFGDPDGVGGEAKLYYDHRHDGYAAGLLLTGLGSGVAGHFGFDLRGYFSETFGVRLDAQVGSAYVAGLSLLLRQRGSE